MSITKKPKRILGCLLCVLFILISSGFSANASEDKLNEKSEDTYILVVGFDEDVDYSKLMKQCANDGGQYALAMGDLYEQQRNLKIDALQASYEKTSYFTDYDTGSDILAAMDGRSEKIERMKSEHETAGRVYEYLNNRGFSDTVIAGILGNMMAECGGQTLDLQWDIYGGGGAYYGLCQWSLYYNPNVNGCGITDQLDYLMGNIQENMGYFGGSYDYFCSISDAGTAAKYFANYYERGAGASVRAQNAYAALEWINQE